MKLLSGILGLTLTSVVALASANAADIYRAPEGVGGYKDGPAFVGVNWSGFYVGVNGGYGWSANNKTIDFVTHGATTDFIKGPDASGGFGGGQIGYNWQGGYFGPRVVLGIEADIQGSGIGDDFHATSRNGIPGIVKTDLDYFGTVRGRLGYAFDRTLVYATGGFAYGNVNTREIDATINFKNDELLTGFVVGGGVEHKINPSWSIKAEYQYIDLGSYKLNGTDNLGKTFTSNDLDAAFHTVRAGLNYQIHSGYEPLK